MNFAFQRRWITAAKRWLRASSHRLNRRPQLSYHLTSGSARYDRYNARRRNVRREKERKEDRENGTRAMFKRDLPSKFAVAPCNRSRRTWWWRSTWCSLAPVPWPNRSPPETEMRHTCNLRRAGGRACWRSTIDAKTRANLFTSSHLDETGISHVTITNTRYTSRPRQNFPLALSEGDAHRVPIPFIRSFTWQLRASSTFSCGWTRKRDRLAQFRHIYILELDITLPIHMYILCDTEPSYVHDVSSDHMYVRVFRYEPFVLRMA